jgi:PilZ domain
MTSTTTTAKKSRRYTRVGLPKGILVAWEHSGIRRLSRVSVVALGGLFISTEEPPPNGDTIRLIFEIPGGEVRARAVVRDCQPCKGMGIEFTAMGPEARARLHQLMKALSKV